MKKLLYLFCAAALLLSLAACGGPTDEQESQTPTPAPTATPVPTPPIPYTDVPETSNYYHAVVWAYENGIASGGDTFEPLSDCTRGQAITFLWRAMGSPAPQLTECPVSDVSPTDWFYEPVLWAYESGVSTSSAFKPHNTCSNGEALTFLWRAMGKPMAAVSGSIVALAANGAYYERPAAWADNNGLFAQMGAGFDPAAPCSRAYLVSYLYWADGQRASAEQDKALQAEYEQVIADSMRYEVHGSGLVYADYVDVDGDGTVELLTVAVDEDRLKATAAVYANVDGHAKKASETSFEMWIGRHSSEFFLCKADGQLYLLATGLYVEGAGAYQCNTSRFYRLGKNAIVLEHDLDYIEEYSFESETPSCTYTDCDKKVSEGEFKAALEKFTDDSLLYVLESWGSVISISDRGLLPTPGIQVNGAKVNLSANPYISDSNNLFMAPLRDVLEAMGVAVYANSDASVILASTKSDTLTITYKDLSFADRSFDGINSNYYGSDKTYKYSMNGGGFQDIAIEFNNGKAFVPFQTIVSLFGGKAEWNGKAGAIQITSSIPDSSRMTRDELKKLANFDREQASRMAISKGYKGSTMFSDGTLLTGGYSDDDGVFSEVFGGLAFKNGKAVWTLYAVERETSYAYGAEVELYRVDVASDGTIKAYPNQKAWQGVGQV